MPAERLARRRHPIDRKEAAQTSSSTRFVGRTGITLITVAAIQAPRTCGHVDVPRPAGDAVRPALPPCSGRVNRVLDVERALATQLTVLMYILMLVGGIHLRESQLGAQRPYRVPGNKYLAMWVVASMGILGSVFGLVLGFFPPSGIAHWSTPVYVLAMVVGIVVCSVPLFLADILKKPNWKITP